MAGTLALMTGYAQAFQADQNPIQRLLMGTKIVKNFALLAGHPDLTDPFRRVMAGLQERWESMCACTKLALPGDARCCGAAEPSSQAGFGLCAPAPTRLQ